MPMDTPRFTPEFKEEAVKQVTERGYSVAEISAWLGVSRHSLYKWVKAVTPDNSERQATELIKAKSEILCLKAHAKKDARLLTLRDSWRASGGCMDRTGCWVGLCEIGKACGKHRVARIMRQHRIKAQRGHKAPRPITGHPSLLAPTIRTVNSQHHSLTKPG